MMYHSNVLFAGLGAMDFISRGHNQAFAESRSSLSLMIDKGFVAGS
jgi:hypothetical protein